MHLNNGQSQHNDKQDRRRRAGRTRVKKLERLLPYEESPDVRRIVGTPERHNLNCGEHLQGMK
ncbi:hypothetical protein D3C76_1438130 [compost metagenome]